MFNPNAPTSGIPDLGQASQILAALLQLTQQPGLLQAGLLQAGLQQSVPLVETN
jgi:hypothetical protein